MNRQVSEEFLSIKCYIDNKYLTDSIYSTNPVTEKRLQIDICIFREMIAKKEVTSVEWCKSELQHADCLTKGKANSIKLLVYSKIALAYLSNSKTF